jgi:hypothetical protein
VCELKCQHLCILLAAHLVQLHEPLPQAIYLLAVDCRLLASSSWPPPALTRAGPSFAFYAQLEPEAMLSSRPDCWFPMVATGVG